MPRNALVSLSLYGLVGWFCYFGYLMFDAEEYMATTRVSMKANPALAFVSNVNAYQTFPYSVETRRQIPGTFLGLMATGRAEIDAAAAEIVWEISKTVSPWDTAGLVARGAYLLNHGRKAELPEITERLRRVAPWLTETWILDGYVALMNRDTERMRIALTNAPHYARGGETQAIEALTEEFRRMVQ